METPAAVTYIDIRDQSKTDYGTLPGALLIPLRDLSDISPIINDSRIRRDDRLVLYCDKGVLSVEPARLLREAGYDATSLEGGYIAWVLRQIGPSDAAGAADSPERMATDGATALPSSPERMATDGATALSSSPERMAADDAAALLASRAPGAASRDIESSIRRKFRKPIWCNFTKAINTYGLVREGDAIAVCISGGKDSMLMAKLFQELKLHNKFPFTLKFLVMDPGYSPENRAIIESNARRLGIPIEVRTSDIFDAVYTVEKNPCYLCARMRRGHLYAYAREMGCNKIALGHHYDDVIETILMGMLYGGQVQTMMPKLHSTNFDGMELIRPMYLIREDDIKAWRDYNDLHFIACACKFTDTCTTCANNENRSKRVEVKELIAKLKETNPFVEVNIFRSVENVNLSTIVAYKQDGVRHSFLDDYD